MTNTTKTKAGRERGFRDLDSPDPVLQGLGLREAARKTPAGSPTIPIARTLAMHLNAAESKLTPGLGESELKKIDPKLVGLSVFANRHELSLNVSDIPFADLKESIRTKGQDTPVDICEAPPGSPTPYELTAGHRRHRVCLELDAETEGGFTLLALLHPGVRDEVTKVQRMWRENYLHTPPSPYELGVMLQRSLELKVFTSKTDAAEKLSLGNSSITRYLQLAELPSEVLHAIGDVRKISVRWAEGLAAALKVNKSALLAAAASLSAKRPTGPDAPDQVVRALISSTKVSKAKTSMREEAIKIKNKTVFRVARKNGMVQLKFPKGTDEALQDKVYLEMKNTAERYFAKLLEDNS
jgi:ParB family chromosome partitioning protein